jgi:nucleotide-binding universal stress UspA family protein
MFGNILLPTDGTRLSADALRSGVALARALGARVAFVTTSIPFEAMVADPLMMQERGLYEDSVERVARERLEAAVAMARAAGVEARGEHLYAMQPYEGILDACARCGCDAIAMASHGRHGIGAVVLGSTTQKVLTHAKVPVIVFRPPAEAPANPA